VNFGPELEMVTNNLYRLIPNANVSRIGLRYINALRSDAHGVKSIDDLDIKIVIGDGKLMNSLNLNFKTDGGEETEIMSRIASVDFAQGVIPQNATVIVDIDVYTRSTFSTQDSSVVKSWVNQAHDKEKQSFFKVLGDEATERLRED
jgi:uncharacterized protein (TIGR04255 family)